MLFVYGTLLSKSSHPMAKKLRNQSLFIGAGLISGRLYSLGRFPGLTLSDDPRDKVYGEVMRLQNPTGSFIWLDNYEACGQDAPEPRPYERVLLPVILTSGRHLDAWAYIYKLPVSRARQIPTGRFMVD